MRAIVLLGSLFLLAGIVIHHNVVFAESDQAPFLKGLPGVGVYLVYIVDPTWNAISKKDVETEVELRLRRSGIKVYPFNPSDPYLKVTFFVCDTAIGIPGTYMLFINVSLNEQIRPLRKIRLDKDRFVDSFVCSTWTGAYSAYSLSIRTSTRITLDNLDKELDQFINDYLAVNSK